MTVLIGIVAVFALLMINLCVGLCISAKVSDEQIQEAIHTEMKENNKK